MRLRTRSNPKLAYRSMARRLGAPTCSQETNPARHMSRKVADDVGREPFASVIGVRADGAHLRVARKKQALSAQGDELVARAHAEK